MDRGGDRRRSALAVGGVAAPEAPSGATGLSNVFGIRILARLGPARLIGLIGLVFWVGAIAWLPLALRPDLLRPADFGSDTSNYVAAGERLLGRLRPLCAGGRRSARPRRQPPGLVGPDPVAALARGRLGAGHPPPAVRSSCTRAGPRAWRSPRRWASTSSSGHERPSCSRSSAPMILLALVAWSGNVNAILAPALAFGWWLSARRPSRNGEWTLGAVIGLAAMLKLGPAMVVVWLLGQRRLSAVIAAAVAALASAAVAMVLGGTGIFAEYVDVVLHSTSEASPMSVPGLMRGLGFSATAGLVGAPTRDRAGVPGGSSPSAGTAGARSLRPSSCRWSRRRWSARRRWWSRWSPSSPGRPTNRSIASADEAAPGPPGRDGDRRRRRRDDGGGAVDLDRRRADLVDDARQRQRRPRRGPVHGRRDRWHLRVPSRSRPGRLRMARAGRDAELARVRDDAGLRHPVLGRSGPGGDRACASARPRRPPRIEPAGEFLDYVPDCAEAVGLAAAIAR